MRFGLANRRRLTTPGFTLLELLTAGSVFLLILALTLVMISNLTRLTTESTSSLAAFQEARTAFETMNRLLSQAVLNTYLDYDNPATPQHYLRASELHFTLGPAADLTGLTATAGSAIFCQAPLGLASAPALKSQPDLLNALGFYIRFSPSEDLPDFMSAKKPATAAWRLWMLIQPAEDLSIYELYNGNPQKASDYSWFRSALAVPEYNHVLANHIILVLIRAGYPDASGNWRESYLYNTRGTSASSAFPQATEIHQLPPTLHLTLVAIDQRTADRLLAHQGGNAYDLMPGTPGLFTDAAHYREDLAALQTHLNERPIDGIPINFRVFEASVKPTSAKWSK